MSDSRISVALGEAVAIIELMDNALVRLDELMQEDPSFSLPVAADLRRAEDTLLYMRHAAKEAIASLRRADRAENGRGVA